MVARILLAVLLGTVAGAAAAGFMAIGSPATQRERRFDERRVDDLSRLEGAISDYFRRHERLPAVLAELPVAEHGLRDPLTSLPYEYVVKDRRRYELCADFRQDGRDGRLGWTHQAGRHCFGFLVQ